ncbi:sigma-54 interaction domain protein [Bordetella holmesii 70147]|nr:sigma-54 interaction domain protein [Bordetella holmesii 70147]
MPTSASSSSAPAQSARFEGTDRYVATDDLKLAVNAALTLQRPLLIKGEPGTGKTMLAEEVARALDRPLLQWHIKSTTKAHQGLYEYDAVSRLRDSQLGDEKVRDIRNYIVQGTLWQAFEAPEPVVLLIDEIDKADIEFPNDLLRELDRMEFHVYETRQTVQARHRPLVIITSNNEKDLPDAFLRRCFFHYIRFPDRDTMRDIVGVHYPDIRQDVLRAALDTFFALREAPGLKKKPSTSELLDWLRLLLAEAIPAAEIDAHAATAVPVLAGALLKNEQDVHLLERLAPWRAAPSAADATPGPAHANRFLLSSARPQAAVSVQEYLTLLEALRQRLMAPRSTISTSWRAPRWSRTKASTTAMTPHSAPTIAASPPPCPPTATSRWTG